MDYRNTPIRIFLGGSCLIILTVSVLTSAAGQVRAQEKIPISELKVQAELKADGQVHVRQIITFAAANGLNWLLYSNARQLTVAANNVLLKADQFERNYRSGRTVVKSAFPAKQWVVDYTTTTTLIRHNDRDQVYFKVFQELGRSASDIEITLTLPPDVKEAGLNGNIYAIGGALGEQTVVLSPHEIRFSARYTGPKALLTISANWPKSVLQLNTYQELRLALSNLELIPWLGLGLLLPLLSLLVLWRIKLRLRFSEKPVKEISDQPPSNLAPILVGVLVRKKIYPEEITALIIDLCRRGYMVLVKKNGHYYLSQRRAADTELESWEERIVSQLFPNARQAVNPGNFELTNQQALFSPKVRDAFAQIYQVITDKQFFVENPHVTRVRYKLFALLLYFTGVVGIIWMAVTGSSPVLLIPLVGTIGVAFLIIRLSPKLIHYSPEGQLARLGWLAFGNFLALRKALPMEASQNQTFERYLPYAVALGVTTKWARRFDLSRTAIIRPDWFICYEDSSTVEFAEELRAFSGALAKEITSLRGPLVS